MMQIRIKIRWFSISDIEVTYNVQCLLPGGLLPTLGGC